jgi:hypothetical protein
LALGEKVFESKQKATATAVKAVGPEGVTIEQSWTGEVKGLGRAQGLIGTITGTGTYVQTIGGSARGSAQGLIITKEGETVVYKTNGVGKTEGNKGKFAALTTYMTVSPKLSWMNNLVTLDEAEGNPTFTEFTLTGQEWK